MILDMLSNEEADWLKRPFSKEDEVWEAICVCNGSKAPRPDGFNFKCIKSFWELLKPEFMHAILWL